MLVHATSEKKLGPVIPVNCPSCLEENVDGQSYAMVDTVLLLMLIPMHTRATIYLSCPKCKRTFKPLIPLSEISDHPIAVRGQYLREHVSIIQILLGILAFFLCWIPVLGVVIAAIALLVNWQASTWLKVISTIATVVGFASTGIFLLLSA